MIGNLAESEWYGNPWRRRAIAAVVTGGLLIASVFPAQYRAAVSLAPADPASLGLGGALGQLGGGITAFGNQAAIEVGLRVARSPQVSLLVVRRLGLVKREGLSDEPAAQRWLDSRVDIRALRGGILSIEFKTDDKAFGLSVVDAYTQSTRERLSEISRVQTAYKRKILTDLVIGASNRLAVAQEAYDSFRRTSKYAEPSSAIGAIGGRVPSLQAQLKDKEVALEATRAFATDNNMSVRQILSEMKIIRKQLAQAQSLDPSEPYAVNRVVVQSTQVAKLQRELSLAQGLYDNYKRYLEGTSVEDLASTGNIRILEPAYIDPARQYRMLPLSLALIVILITLMVEFYLMRPPLASVRVRGRADA